MNRHFTKNDKVELVSGEFGTPITVRKRARTIAVKQHEAFTVDTDQGTIGGKAGDYLVTNHPDDDPTSDVWPVSEERFRATYEPDTR